MNDPRVFGETAPLPAAQVQASTVAVLAEQMESEARVLAEGNAAPSSPFAVERSLLKVMRSVQPCTRCGKSTYVATIVAGRRPRLEVPTPVHHCACPQGVVDRSDEWAVVFLRSARDLSAAVRLRSPWQSWDILYPLEMEGATPHAFEWGDHSAGCRELAVAMLALIAGTARAVALADRFVDEVLSAVAKMPKKGEAKLGMIRQWVEEKEATNGAAA